MDASRRVPPTPSLGRKERGERAVGTEGAGFVLCPDTSPGSPWAGNFAFLNPLVLTCERQVIMLFLCVLEVNEGRFGRRVGMVLGTKQVFSDCMS